MLLESRPEPAKRQPEATGASQIQPKQARASQSKPEPARAIKIECKKFAFHSTQTVRNRSTKFSATA